jgi:hypothetical protein
MHIKKEKFKYSKYLNYNFGRIQCTVYLKIYCTLSNSVHKKGSEKGNMYIYIQNMYTHVLRVHITFINRSLKVAVRRPVLWPIPYIHTYIHTYYLHTKQGRKMGSILETYVLQRCIMP